jgi:phosphate transporter
VGAVVRRSAARLLHLDPPYLGLLLASYRPARAPDSGRDIEIRLICPTREHFTLKQWWVTFVCVVTIALWCFARQPELKRYFSDMGVIVIIPIVAFFATGVLKKVWFCYCCCFDI